jgi:leucine-rich repeat kinase 2
MQNQMSTTMSLSYFSLYFFHLFSLFSILNVDGNPLKSPPPEIVQKGRKEIIDFLRDLAQGSEPCYRTKLMVVGQGIESFFSLLFIFLPLVHFFLSSHLFLVSFSLLENVGKTTLIKRLKNIKHRKKGKDNEPENISTDGIDIADWVMKIPFKVDGEKKKIPVTFSVWGKFATNVFFFEIFSF